MRAGLARELEQLGFAVTEAVDGQSGFDTARSQEFELIITDIGKRFGGRDLGDGVSLII